MQRYIRIILDVLMHFTCQLLEPSLDKSLSKETFARYRSMQYGVNRAGAGAKNYARQLGGALQLSRRIFVKNT